MTFILPQIFIHIKVKYFYIKKFTFSFWWPAYLLVNLKRKITYLKSKNYLYVHFKCTRKFVNIISSHVINSEIFFSFVNSARILVPMFIIKIFPKNTEKYLMKFFCVTADENVISVWKKYPKHVDIINEIVLILYKLNLVFSNNEKAIKACIRLVIRPKAKYFVRIFSIF